MCFPDIVDMIAMYRISCQASVHDLTKRHHRFFPRCEFLTCADACIVRDHISSETLSCLLQASSAWVCKDIYLLETYRLLVVSTNPFEKYAQVKLDHYFPKEVGVKITNVYKCLSCHQLDIMETVSNLDPIIWHMTLTLPQPLEDRLLQQCQC